MYKRKDLKEKAIHILELNSCFWLAHLYVDRNYYTGAEYDNLEYLGCTDAECTYYDNKFALYDSGKLHYYKRGI